MKCVFFRGRVSHLSLVLGLVFVFFVPVANSSEDTFKAEVMVFVDVSGSMIKNDPENMRAPAIRMLAGMAPEDARVGIYLFGTSVRELVAPAVVNQSWKNNVEKASGKFRSRDMYTNIEAALKTANKNWSSIKDLKRSVILLTDGIVDIDKNRAVSNASRERILGPVLDEFKQNNINVNTIALSQNADHDLLQQLAFQTDGKNQQVDDAESLQRTFMHLFEQSAPQDTLPLNGNVFTVDNSISELTLLVFRKENSEATQVITPEGETYTQSYAVDGLNWKHDKGFDLISVAHPIAGEWKIVADEDPDNRALIVTDLKLKSTELPSNILKGESLDWIVWLENKEKVITKKEFLELISASLTNTQDGNVEQSWILQPANESGQFLQRLGSEWKAGNIDLHLKVDGGTFIREKRVSINVHASPVEVSSELMDEKSINELLSNQQEKTPSNKLSFENIPEPVQGWNIRVNARQDLIDLSASELLLEARSQSDKKIPLKAEKNDQGWVLNFLPEEAGQYQIFISFKGKSLTGREVSMPIEPLVLGEMVSLAEVVALDETENITVPSMKEFIIPVVFGNIIFLMLFFGWKYLKRLRENAILQPEEAL